jgi:hypothetical protein
MCRDLSEFDYASVIWATAKYFGVKVPYVGPQSANVADMDVRQYDLPRRTQTIAFGLAVKDTALMRYSDTRLAPAFTEGMMCQGVCRTEPRLFVISVFSIHTL